MLVIAIDRESSVGIVVRFLSFQSTEAKSVKCGGAKIGDDALDQLSLDMIKINLQCS